MYFFTKTLLSALVIAVVTQLAEKMPKASALIKSLPLTSLMVFLVMKYEGRTNDEISSISRDILLMIVPSLILFIALPLLLDRGLNFYVSLLISTGVMSLGYLVMYKFV